MLEMLKDMIEEKQIQEDWLQQSIDELMPIKADFDEIDAIGKKTVMGKVQMLPEECEKQKTLAKEAVKSRGIIVELKEKLGLASKYINQLKAKIDVLTEAMEPFRQALIINYDKVHGFFAELLRQDKADKEYEIVIAPKKPKRRDYER